MNTKLLMRYFTFFPCCILEMRSVFQARISVAHTLRISKARWPRAAGEERLACRALQARRPPWPPRVGIPLFLLLFRWMLPPSQAPLPPAPPQPSPGAAHTGVEAAGFQGEGRLLPRPLHHAPRRQGDGHKGPASGYNSGRLVTVPGSGRVDRAPCVCAWPGWALRPGFPCRLPIPARLFVWAPPHWPINPLLPTTYLAPLPGSGSHQPCWPEAGSCQKPGWCLQGFSRSLLLGNRHLP